MEDLPLEYQVDFGQAAEKEALARRLLEMAQRQQPGVGQMVGPFFVKTHPLQHLASVLGQWQGSMLQGQAQAEKAEALKRAADAKRTALESIATAMLGRPGSGVAPTGEVRLDPEGDMMRSALTSGFKEPQQLARALWESKQQNFRSLVPHADPESAIQAAQQGGNVAALRPPPVPTWRGESFTVPGQETPVPALVSSKGELRFPPTAPQTTVNVNTDRALSNMAQEAFKNLNDPKRLSTIATLQKTLDSASAAMNVLHTMPLNLGVDSDVKTVVQSFAKLFGKEVPPNVPATQFYNSQIIPMIGNIISMFGAGTGLSDADRQAAEKALALARNDPRMIKVALGYAIRGAVKELRAYENQTNSWAQLAERAGVPPEVFLSQKPQFKIPIPPGSDFPPDFEKPGVLEEWAAATIGGPRPQQPIPPRPVQISPDTYRRIEQWLPRR